MSTEDLHWTTGPAGLARRRWRIVVESGPDRGQAATLRNSTMLVGAAPASVLPLSDDTVSRYHAELDMMTAGLRIRDLRSTNGTYLVDREGPVAQAFLWPGSRFRIGETWLRVDAVDEPAAPPSASTPVQLGGLVGRSSAMQGVFRLARHLGAAHGTVLIVGPVGSGRGAVARQMHRLSPRAERALVTVEAEPDPTDQLFGRPDSSLLLRAHQGTLLLRDVDQFSRPLQVKLRETLERGDVQPGDSRRLDLRVVATCVDPRKIESSLRRHLSVAQLIVPPLEERPEELVALAEHFLHGAGWDRIRLGFETARRLAEVSWPGQVAGLSRLVQRLPRPPDTADEALPALPALRRAFLQDLLHARAGNVTDAATDLAVPQAQLFRTLHAYDIDIDAL